MKRTILALALCLGGGTAACGDSSCEDAINHGAKLLGNGGFGYGGKVSAEDLKQGIQMCKDEKWSGALRNCIAGARDLLELRGCEKHRKK